MAQGTELPTPEIIDMLVEHLRSRLTAAQRAGKKVGIEISADLWEWEEGGFVRRAPNGASRIIVSIPADRLARTPQ